jgi:hypothetical protein
MKLLRSIGALMLACSAICLIIAIQKYVNAVTTAKAIAEAIDGVEFESVALPIETKVCGLAGVVLLVSGVRLLFESFRRREKPVDGMLSGSDGK